MRLLRRGVLLAVLLLLVGALAFFFTTRPGLEDARDDVDRTWNAALAPLDARYTLLSQANAPLQNRPGPAGQLSADVTEELRRWVDAREGKDRAAAVAAANDLEGLGRRVVVLVSSSQALSADPAVKGPVDAYAKAALPAELAAYGRAVQKYEDERKGPVRSVVADLFGYDSVPSVAVPDATPA
jgi:hypothetical protein